MPLFITPSHQKEDLLLDELRETDKQLKGAAAINKPALQLSPGEAALLAAMLPNPKRRSAKAPRPAIRRIAGVVQTRAARSGAIDACLGSRKGV